MSHSEKIDKNNQLDHRVTIEDILTELRPKIEAQIALCLPRAFTPESLSELFGFPRYVYDTETATNSLLVPIWDILDRGGKRWRPALVVLVARALKDFEADPLLTSTIYSLAYLSEMIHNGSLVVDDIEDGSLMRRGKSCLHLIHNLDVGINAGNAMYFLPLAVFKRMAKDGYPKETMVSLYEAYSEELMNLHLGQGFDIWWHSGKKQPNIQEYLQMCLYKTGTLARLSVKLAAILCNASPLLTLAFIRFAESLGVSFQIQDDLLNLIGETFAQKIAIQGEDIFEGKRTLMVIHCMENAPKAQADRLQSILNMHTHDPVLVKEAIEILKKNGSFEYAQQMAKEIVISAWKDLEIQLPDSQAKQHLKLFADFMVQREN